MIKNKNFSVEVIIPSYIGTNQIILKKCKQKLKKQSYKNFKIIDADGNNGLANAYNNAIKNSKADIVFLWQDDCFAQNKDYIERITKYFTNEKIDAVTCKIFLSKKLWKKFDLPTKILTEKETFGYQPEIALRGSAFRRESFYKFGFFDAKTFRNSGEIHDLEYRWKKANAKYIKVSLRIEHYHPETFRGRLKKEKQYGNGDGAFFKKHKARWKYLIKGIIPYTMLRSIIKPTRLKDFKIKFFWAPFINLLANIYYSIGFWKGFLKGKQRISYK